MALAETLLILWPLHVSGSMPTMQELWKRPRIANAGLAAAVTVVAVTVAMAVAMAVAIAVAIAVATAMAAGEVEPAR